MAYGVRHMGPIGEREGYRPGHTVRWQLNQLGATAAAACWMSTGARPREVEQYAGAQAQGAVMAQFLKLVLLCLKRARAVEKLPHCTSRCALVMPQYGVWSLQGCDWWFGWLVDMAHPTALPIRLRGPVQGRG